MLPGNPGEAPGCQQAPGQIDSLAARLGRRKILELQTL